MFVNNFLPQRAGSQTKLSVCAVPTKIRHAWLQADPPVWTVLIGSIKCRCFGGPESKNLCFPPSIWESEKIIHRASMTVSTRKYLTCVVKEKERGGEERRETVTIHYPLLPAIITGFSFFPFLAPQLHSDFHLVKSNKKGGPSCVKPRKTFHYKRFAPGSCLSVEDAVQAAVNSTAQHYLTWSISTVSSDVSPLKGSHLLHPNPGTGSRLRCF